MKVQNLAVTTADNDIRLDRWFKRHFPNLTHIMIEKALRKGQIRVDGKRIKSSYRLMTGQIIRVPPFKLDIDNVKAKRNKIKRKPDDNFIKQIINRVIYKDKNIIAIDKPIGIAVQGGSKIKQSIDDVLEYLKFDSNEKPKLVHRIDKDTSGVLLIARNVETANFLMEKFKKKEIEKTYLAIVAGRPKHNAGKIVTRISKKDGGGGKEKMHIDEEKGQLAITNYQVIDSIKGRCALLKLLPQTGRMHQLRLHCAELASPILGDGKYGGKNAFIDDKKTTLHLHAAKIEFYDKTTRYICIKSPLPLHFVNSLKNLGLEKSYVDI